MSKELRELEKIFDWLHKVTDYFKPYKPDVKSMVINYRNLSSEINLLLHIPDSMKRKIVKVEIPAYQNFVITDMMDESFNRIRALWRFEDGKWKLDSKALPESEMFLVTLKGKVPKTSLLKLIRIQPARNRDQTEEFDRYWLDSMIRNVGLLEQIWHELNVEDVNVAARVGIERCFSTTVPKELKAKLKATRRWIQAGHGRSREEVFRAWADVRRASRALKIPVDKIVDLMYKLTIGETFTSFLSVDRPYSLGDVRREEQLVSLLFPERMLVEAITELSLKQPTATGYLTFKKEDYTETIEESFSELL